MEDSYDYNSDLDYDYECSDDDTIEECDFTKPFTTVDKDDYTTDVFVEGEKVYTLPTDLVKFLCMKDDKLYDQFLGTYASAYGKKTVAFPQNLTLGSMTEVKDIEVKDKEIITISVCGTSLIPDAKFFKESDVKAVDYMLDNPDKHIIVHCNHGVDRSPKLVLKYLQKLHPQEHFYNLYLCVKNYRPVINPSLTLKF